MSQDASTQTRADVGSWTTAALHRIALAAGGTGDLDEALRCALADALATSGARGLRLLGPVVDDETSVLVHVGELRGPVQSFALLLDGDRVGTLEAHGDAVVTPSREELAVLATATRVHQRGAMRHHDLDRLRQSEARYRALVEASDELIQSIDRDGRILFVNSFWQRTLGCEGVPLEGRSIFDFVHGDAHSGCRELLRTVMAGRAVHGVLVTFRGPLGERVEVEGDVLPRIENGEVTACHAFLRDTSRLRETEADRARKTAFLDQVVEGAPEAILFLSIDGTVQRVNSEFTRLFGYTADEAVGRKIDDLVVPRALAKEGRELCDRAGQSESVNIETVRRRKDSSLVAVSMLATPIRVDGQQVATLCIYRDISSRKQLEARLALAQRMEAVGRLAGGIAHDFNNLLTVVQASTDLLAEQIGPEHPAHADVEEIARATQKAAALTRHLLSFGRRQIAQPVVLDLARAVDECAGMLRRLIPEDVQFTVEHAAGTRRVKADPGQFEQVLMNLALNARDAMPHGGRLRLATRTALVDGVAARNLSLTPGSYAELAVEDTGCGIPAEDLHRVFEPFWTTKAGGDRGTGLGLATVYSIVQQCRGAVAVESQVGKGSRFTVYMPLADGEPAVERTVERTPDVTRATAETILVVEDDQAIRQLVERSLVQAGFRVLTAATPSEARNWMDREGERISLLFTDVVMPETSGPELAAELSSKKKGLRVLFTSGYADDRVFDSAEAPPGALFLPKPYTFATLTAKVRAALDA